MATVGLDLSTTLKTRKPFLSVRSRKTICGIFVCAVANCTHATAIRVTGINKKLRLILNKLLSPSPFGEGWVRVLLREKLRREGCNPLSPHPALSQRERDCSVHIQWISINLSIAGR